MITSEQEDAERLAKTERVESKVHQMYMIIILIYNFGYSDLAKKQIEKLLSYVENDE